MRGVVDPDSPVLLSSHSGEQDLLSRDAERRMLYLTSALADIPRLLGAADRNPYRATYGCFDREFWHYRTACFPSEMYQEGVLPLALVYARDMPGNRWYGSPRVRELAIAGIRFAARSCHADGSCDDYYPFERALGAAVFSLLAAVKAYRLLELDDAELVEWLRLRAEWLSRNDESGRLTNHHAMAALGLLHVAEVTGEDRYRLAAAERIDRVLEWQDEEGWFDEYGGADPGYQTVTIDCLANYRRILGERRLDEPIRRAVAFCRAFLHPDNSYAGEYGSRGTYHFYPHGMELLATGNADAADLADGYLESLAAGTQAHFSDDRLYTHRLANRIEAYLDWSPDRPRSGESEPDSVQFFPRAGLLVRRKGSAQTVISAARGGVFKHFGPGLVGVSDAGVIVETVDGRVAVSQQHELGREVEFGCVRSGRMVEGGQNGELANSGPGTPACGGHCLQASSGTAWQLSVAGPLHWCRFETATPLKQSILHSGMWLVGRWCRTLVRRVLQRRLITGRSECPIRLSRSFEILDESDAEDGCLLRVVDRIELTEPGVRVRRMAFGSDHQTAYVAASGIYQDAVLSEWTDLSGYVDELNSQGAVTVQRRV